MPNRKVVVWGEETESQLLPADLIFEGFPIVVICGDYFDKKLPPVELSKLAKEVVGDR